VSGSPRGRQPISGDAEGRVTVQAEFDEAPFAIGRGFGFHVGMPAADAGKHKDAARQGAVCIIDDDLWVCDSLSVLLETYGIAVLCFSSAADFLRDGGNALARCLVIDQHMPGASGLDLIGDLRQEGVLPPTILISGRLDAAIERRATELGVLAILEKPFQVARFLDLVRAALDQSD
jgi:two-component system, LuxR family, response regulator FixJ